MRFPKRITVLTQTEGKTGELEVLLRDLFRQAGLLLLFTSYLVIKYIWRKCVSPPGGIKVKY
jgi:hypothetical protein